MNIYKKINAVMKLVKYVKKDQSVSGGGANYKAVTRDSVIEIIREHLVEVGIVIEITQVSGSWAILRDVNATPNPIKMGLYSGTYNISFVNIDDHKDRATVKFDSHAQDNGDKAPGKAATYAEKLAIIKMFSLETGIDDEEVAEKGVSQESVDTFVYMLESDQALEMNDFLADFPPESELRDALFDGLPYGQKTKYKRKFQELSSKANDLYTTYAMDLEKAASKDNNYEVQELWTDNSKTYKRCVWARLNDDTKQYLTDMNNG